MPMFIRIFINLSTHTYSNCLFSFISRMGVRLYSLVYWIRRYWFCHNITRHEGIVVEEWRSRFAQIQPDDSSIVRHSILFCFFKFTISVRLLTPKPAAQYSYIDIVRNTKFKLMLSLASFFFLPFYSVAFFLSFSILKLRNAQKPTRSVYIKSQFNMNLLKYYSNFHEHVKFNQFYIHTYFNRWKYNLSEISRLIFVIGPYWKMPLSKA